MNAAFIVIMASMGILTEPALAAGGGTLSPRPKKTDTKATVKWPKLSANSIYAFALACGKTANVCASVTPRRLAPKFSWVDPAGVLAITAGTDPSCNEGNGGFLTIVGPATGCSAGSQTITSKLNGKIVSTAQGAIFDIVGTLSPDDNFAGRNQDKYGIAETVQLGVTITPTGITATDIGGLKWTVQTGVGDVPAANIDGTGSYAAGPTPGNVTLQLQGLSGPAQGVTKSFAKTVTAPTGNYQPLYPGSSIGHRVDTVSVGMLTLFFILPKDVSFRNIKVREGAGTGAGSGIYASLTGKPHTPSTPVMVSNCNITTGCQWMDTTPTGLIFVDRVGMCPRAPVANNTGGFEWPISNDYVIGSAAPVSYTTAIHHGTSDRAGLCCISKAGTGPHCKAVADATVTTQPIDAFGTCP